MTSEPIMPPSSKADAGTDATNPSSEANRTALTFGLSANTLKQIRRVLAQHPTVETAIIYGSRALGNFRAGSDIDLTLLGPELTHATLLRIANDIDDLLLPYLFDLSLFNHLSNPDLIEHIRRIGKPFYQRPHNSTSLPL